MAFVFIFIFGAIIGSFLNVVLLRKNTGESFVSGPSRCFSCGTALAPSEMIPIFSFLAQKGRCRHCGSKISLQYLLVEFLMGIAAAAVYYNLFYFAPYAAGFSAYLLLIFYFASFAALFLVAAYDFRTKIIDSQLLYAFGVFAGLQFFGKNNFFQDFLSSLLIALFFYAVWRFSGGKWMGRGDADLAFWCGIFLGWPLNIIGLFLSFWIGGVIGILLLILRSGKFGLKSEIPFGPFLALGVFLAWFFAGAFLIFYHLIF